MIVCIRLHLCVYCGTFGLFRLMYFTFYNDINGNFGWESKFHRFFVFIYICACICICNRNLIYVGNNTKYGIRTLLLDSV